MGNPLRKTAIRQNLKDHNFRSFCALTGATGPLSRRLEFFKGTHTTYSSFLQVLADDLNGDFDLHIVTSVSCHTSTS